MTYASVENPGGGIQAATAKTALPDRRTGGYRGSTGQYTRRDIQQYEYSWNLEPSVLKEKNRITFDGLIAGAIKRARDKGRNEVVIFDFGCGNSIAAREFLADPNSEAMKLIMSNPKIKVKLIGLTDTTDVDHAASATQAELKAGEQLKSTDTEPRNLSGRVDYEYITAANTLEKYLRRQKINKIDVIMSAEALEYLPVPNFERTLRAMIGHLQTGGVLIGAYSPGRWIPGFVHAGDYPIINTLLDVRSKTAGPSLQATLRDTDMRFREEKIDIKREAKNLERALKMYVNLGVITQEEIDSKIITQSPKWMQTLNRMGVPPRVGQLRLTRKRNARISRLRVLSFLLNKANHLYGQTKKKRSYCKKKGDIGSIKKRISGRKRRC